MNNTRPNSYTYILWLTGLLSAFGPFITDFYLPALPALGAYFHAAASLTQLSLTAGLVGLGFGQLFIGPLSDRLGRRRPLIASLLLFLITTLACILTSDIHLFLFYRLLQGIAGAGGVVIARAIATDLYEGNRLARYFAMLSVVQGLAPILAPVLGGFLLTVTDWRGIFTILLLLGVALLLLLLPFRETHRPLPAASRPLRWATFSHYPTLFRHPVFLRNTILQALAMGVMFTYIASSPYIFQQHYELSPILYSLCFGINAFAIMAGSLFVTRFPGPTSALRLGTRAFCVAAVFVALSLFTNAPFLLVEIAFLFLTLSLGLIMPTTTTLAMTPVRHLSGTASALLGFMGFLVGGICSPLAGLGNMLHTTSFLILFCAAGTLVFAPRHDSRGNLHD